MLMAPYGLKLALPVALLFCSAWLCSKPTRTRHPGLIVCFLATTAWILLSMFVSGFKIYSVPFQIVSIAGLVFEILTFSRLKPSPKVRNAFIAATLVVSLGLAILKGDGTFHVVALFRQNCLIAIAAVAIWAAAYRLKYPLTFTSISIRRERVSHPECFRHKVQRIGGAVWALSYAITGAFVPKGIGYLIFPFQARVYYAVEYASIVSLLIVACTMTLMMAPVLGRKRAAVWAGKQKVVTGKLEAA